VTIRRRMIVGHLRSDALEGRSSLRGSICVMSHQLCRFLVRQASVRLCMLQARGLRVSLNRVFILELFRLVGISRILALDGPVHGPW